jgi:hypothetical protein
MEMEDNVPPREEDFIDHFQWPPPRGIESPYFETGASASEDE